MSFLFNRSNRPKTPQDLVRTVRESISRLDVPSEKKRAIEEITKCLNAMKTILIGDGGTMLPPHPFACFALFVWRIALTNVPLVNIEADPIPEQVVLLSQEIYTSDLLQILSLNLYRFEFEAKKDFTSIFNTLLRRQVGETRYPTVEYLAQKGEILLVLTKGYCTQLSLLLTWSV
jgi:calcium binding protein 39